MYDLFMFVAAQGAGRSFRPGLERAVDEANDT